MCEKVPTMPHPQYSFQQKGIILGSWMHNEVKGLAQAASQGYHQEYNCLVPLSNATEIPDLQLCKTYSCLLMKP